MERRTLWVGVGIMSVIGAIALIFMLTAAEEFHAAVIDPPWPAAEIRLTDHTGAPYQLSSRRSEIALVFFGFTNCAEECPLTMAKLRQVFEMLGPQSEDVEVLFITTDPARDTPEALKDYLANFDSRFLGLTGTPSELQRVWSDYGVMVLDEGETHSTRVYVIDHNGDIRLTFPYEMQAAEMASDLELLLKDE